MVSTDEKEPTVAPIGILDSIAFMSNGRVPRKRRSITTYVVRVLSLVAAVCCVLAYGAGAI